MFEKKITLGNVIQIIMLGVAIIGGYFGMVASINANTKAIEQNNQAIRQMQTETKSLDVLEFKVDTLSESIARIEKKLDE